MKYLCMRCLWFAVLVACSTGSQEVHPPDLLGLAYQLGAGKFLELIDHADLNSTLQGHGPLTVCGPTNEAFAAIPDKVMKDWYENRTALQEVMKYHLHVGRVMSSDVRNEQLLSTLRGTKARVNIYPNGLATVTGAEVATSTMDQPATNGVFHLMDKVIYPVPTGNVVDAISNPSSGIFSTLLRAIRVAGLVNQLRGAGPFTMFAPSNEAFAKIPHEKLQELFSNPPLLASILLYHVVPSTLYRAGLSEGDYTTVNGNTIMVYLSHDGLMVNDAKVVMADLSVTNGVVHTIDTVLLPPKY